MLAWLKSAKNIETVVLVGRWIKYLDGSNFKNEAGDRLLFIRDSQTLETSLKENKKVFDRSLTRTLNALNSLDKRIVVLGPTPEIGSNVPNALTLQAMIGQQIGFEPTRAEFDQRQERVFEYFRRLETRGKIEFQILHDLFCDTERCRASKDGWPLFYDDDHLSKAGARHLRSRLVEILKPIIQLAN